VAISSFTGTYFPLASMAARYGGRSEIEPQGSPRRGSDRPTIQADLRLDALSMLKRGLLTMMHGAQALQALHRVDPEARWITMMRLDVINMNSGFDEVHSLAHNA
jgi:hypothetical protein